MEQLFQLDNQQRKLLERLVTDTEYLRDMYSAYGAARMSIDLLIDEGLKDRSIAYCEKMEREYNKMYEVLKAILHNTDTEMTKTRKWQTELQVPVNTYKRCIRETIKRVNSYKKITGNWANKLEIDVCNAQIELLEKLLLHRKSEC